MISRDFDDVLAQIQQGRRCRFGFEDEEFSTVVSIEQNSDSTYAYSSATSHKYDVVAPTHYDHRILNEDALRTLLSGLPGEAFDRISFEYQDNINEGRREKANLIYSYLMQAPRKVYVVLKEDRRESPYMDFSSLFKHQEQAEQMVEYVRTRQGARSYWKEITLTCNGKEIELRGELSQFDRVNSKQILVTLLDIDDSKLARFFEE